MRCDSANTSDSLAISRSVVHTVGTMRSSHPSIGAKIRWHRSRLGWSLRELGARSGTPYSLIGRWENRGADPSFAQASRLAEALGIPVESLWDTTPAPASPPRGCAQRAHMSP